MRQLIHISLCLMLFIGFTTPVLAEDDDKVETTNKLEYVKNFQQLATIMQTKNIGLLLALDAPYCHFCKQLEEDVLNPMLLSGDYDDQILIYKLSVDSNMPIVGFDGKTTSGAEFAEKLGVSLTPTMVFIDHTGKEISERMLGVNTPEMYGAYIDDAIDETRKVLTTTKVEQTADVQQN